MLINFLKTISAAAEFQNWNSHETWLHQWYEPLYCRHLVKAVSPGCMTAEEPAKVGVAAVSSHPDAKADWCIPEMSAWWAVVEIARGCLDQVLRPHVMPTKIKVTSPSARIFLEPKSWPNIENWKLSDQGLSRSYSTPKEMCPWQHSTHRSTFGIPIMETKGQSNTLCPWIEACRKFCILPLLAK